jgi:DNA-binding CsgD family transcriptional regulator
MINLNDFFTLKNGIHEIIGSQDTKQTNDYIKVIDTFASLIYQSIHVIDYKTKRFEYVSDNPLFLCGYTSKDVLDLRFDFLLQRVIPEDLNLLVTINRIGFDFFEKIPKDKRELHFISFDFHMKDKNNNSILVNQKLTPLFLTSKGKLWKAISIISLSTKRSSGHIKICNTSDFVEYYYNLKNETWHKKEKRSLSDREKGIIRLSARGYSINEISDKLFITSGTVKYHRKNIYKKLKVNTISEAIVYAFNNRML